MPSQFEGFPAGELQYIAVPDLFFTGLTPLVDDLAELKVLLHIVWLRQRRGRQVLTGAELRADETLLQSLAAVGGQPELLLESGLQRAVVRGALLHAAVETPTGLEDVYALNSEGGRRSLEEVRQGRLGVERVVVVDRPAAEPRPNIFELYEDNIGLISPLLADELREAETAYPADWIEDAFRIALENNVRKWRYIQAILEGWATRGRGEDTGGRKVGAEKRWYTDEEYEQFFKH
jgi:DnaD/phage-associated family protein